MIKDEFESNSFIIWFSFRFIGFFFFLFFLCWIVWGCIGNLFLDSFCFLNNLIDNLRFFVFKYSYKLSNCFWSFIFFSLTQFSLLIFSVLLISLGKIRLKFKLSSRFLTREIPDCFRKSYDAIPFQWVLCFNLCSLWWVKSYKLTGSKFFLLLIFSLSSCWIRGVCLIVTLFVI